MINERMRRPCTCQTSRAVMIGCQARGARCEARGARSMTGSKAAPEAPRGLVPCRLVMSRAPPTRAARHLCAWLCASTSVEPTWSRVFYAQRSDARRYGYQNACAMYIAVSHRGHHAVAPRAHRARRGRNGMGQRRRWGRAARRARPGTPRGARAGRPKRGPSGRPRAHGSGAVGTASSIPSGGVDRPGRSRRIRFRSECGMVLLCSPSVG